MNREIQPEVKIKIQSYIGNAVPNNCIVELRGYHTIRVANTIPLLLFRAVTQQRQSLTESLLRKHV
jgi:hypothetical protein